MGRRPREGSRFPASKRAVDPKRLVEREHPDLTDPKEVRHYIRIYEELVSFKRYLLSRASRTALKSSKGARDDRSVTALQEQLTSLESRLRFWHDRLWVVQGIDLDRDHSTVSHRGKHITLTRREFQLLECLVREPLRYMTARQLIDAAWGNADLGEEELRNYVVRLRKRIDDIALPCRLVNKPRKGYSVIFA